MDGQNLCTSIKTHIYNVYCGYIFHLVKQIHTQTHENTHTHTHARANTHTRTEALTQLTARPAPPLVNEQMSKRLRHVVKEEVVVEEVVVEEVVVSSAQCPHHFIARRTH